MRLTIPVAFIIYSFLSEETVFDLANILFLAVCQLFRNLSHIEIYARKQGTRIIKENCF